MALVKALGRTKLLGDCCEDCPLRERIKVLPTLPPNRKVTVVGLAPGQTEEIQGKNFVGRAGALLRKILAKAGLDPTEDVGYVNLTRCRPIDDQFNAEWNKARRRCEGFFMDDLLTPTTSYKTGTGPLLVCGTDAVKVVKEDRKAQITQERGLWQLSPVRRPFIATWHPAAILRSGSLERAKQFEEDIFRMAKRVNRQDKLPSIKQIVCKNIDTAIPFLTKLALQKTPWAFDIETYDAKKFPSRKGVAVDPFHPDFRVRGIAFATSDKGGFYVDLKEDEENIPLEIRTEGGQLLTEVFTSGADKWAYHGNFDEEGLVAQGWTQKVTNRRGDGLLALIALGDGRRSSNTLARAVTEVLKEPTYWEADKTEMRDLPLEVVAEGAIRDAVATFRLVKKLHGFMENGKYCV